MKNPWNLNAEEVAIMKSLVQIGSNKAVADLLGMTVKRVENVMYRIYKKMKQPGRLLAVLEYDRWARAQETAK